MCWPLEAQHRRPLLEHDVHRDAGGFDAVEVGLQVRADDAHFIDQRLGPFVVAVALQGEDLRRQRINRRFHPVVIDAVVAGVRVAGERAFALQPVEGDHVGLAVGAGGTEAHRAEDARQEGDVVVHALLLVQLAHVAQRADHVKPEDVGLAFFVGAGEVGQRLAHRAFSVERVLDAQAVGDLNGDRFERCPRSVSLDDPFRSVKNMISINDQLTPNGSTWSARHSRGHGDCLPQKSAELKIPVFAPTPGLLTTGNF